MNPRARHLGGGSDLEQDRTHNKSNEITDITNTTGGAWVDPTYDSVGNTTKAPSPMNPTVTRGDQSYNYDAWNRLVEVVADALTLAEYAYDARGFRVQKKEFDAGSHDATRDYYYTSSWQCIEERITDVGTSTTTLDRQYIWGLRYVDDLVRRDRDTTGNGTLDETLYALNDRQFNVVALWDDTAGTSGEVVERMAYDPYGNPQFLNEDFTTKSVSSYNWNTLFQGLHRDEESGLYNNRARMLHALLGRFLQRDPLGYPDGLNAYAAYHVMWGEVDFTGMECIKPPVYNPRDCSQVYDRCIDTADQALEDRRAEIVDEVIDLFDRLNEEEETQFEVVTAGLAWTRDQAYKKCYDNHGAWWQKLARFACREIARAAYYAARGIAWAAYKAAVIAIKVVVAEFELGQFVSASITHRLDIGNCSTELTICLDQNIQNQARYLQKLEDYRECCEREGIDP